MVLHQDLGQHAQSDPTVGHSLAVLSRAFEVLVNNMDSQKQNSAAPAPPVPEDDDASSGDSDQEDSPHEESFHSDDSYAEVSEHFDPIPENIQPPPPSEVHDQDDVWFYVPSDMRVVFTGSSVSLEGGGKSFNDSIISITRINNKDAFRVNKVTHESTSLLARSEPVPASSLSKERVISASAAIASCSAPTLKALGIKVSPGSKVIENIPTHPSLTEALKLFNCIENQFPAAKEQKFAFEFSLASAPEKVFDDLLSQTDSLPKRFPLPGQVHDLLVQPPSQTVTDEMNFRKRLQHSVKVLEAVHLSEKILRQASSSDPKNSLTSDISAASNLLASTAQACATTVMHYSRQLALTRSRIREAITDQLAPDSVRYPLLVAPLLGKAPFPDSAIEECKRNALALHAGPYKRQKVKASSDQKSSHDQGPPRKRPFLAKSQSAKDKSKPHKGSNKSGDNQSKAGQSSQRNRRGYNKGSGNNRQNSSKSSGTPQTYRDHRKSKDSSKESSKDPSNDTSSQ